MRLFSFCFFLTSLLVSSANADSIATDRPGNGNSATIVKRGRMNVETSLAYQRAPSGAMDNSFVSVPTAFRYGVGPLEARLTTSVLGVNVEGESIHATDTSLGMKVQLFSNRDWVPDIALMGDVFFATGADSFTNGGLVADLRSAAFWRLGGGFGLLANLGAELGIGTRVLYVANLGYSPEWIGGRLGVFAELYGRAALSSEVTSLLQIDVGGTLSITDDLQLDLFTQHGLNPDSPPFQLAAGLSIRI